jgi:oxaloacetate decarboxylase gamma subunit
MTDIVPQLMQAASMMAIGMIAVFFFLTLLVAATQQLARLAPPIDDSIPSQASNPNSTSQHSTLDPKLVAVISSAVQQYRNKPKV